MIDFKKSDKFIYPFNYFTMDPVFDDETFKKLSSEFPDLSSDNFLSEIANRNKLTIRTGEDSSISEKMPTWKKFFDWLHSDEVMGFIYDTYKEEMDKWDFTDPDTYWHLDFSYGGDGYRREVHCDSAPRIFNFLIFMNDKCSDGGDFEIYSSDEVESYTFQYFNKPDEIKLYKTVEPKQNTALFFLSTPNSLHAVSEQSNSTSFRKFVYAGLTSKSGPAYAKRNRTI